LRSVVHRTDSPWQPASPDESFEIVRRRLFTAIAPDDLVHRDVTSRRFAEMYAKHPSEFPREVRRDDYEARIKSAYPIHPELFDLLYPDWSTLERFQRTRGVLRLMATVVHALWTRNDKSPLILPSSLPLEDTNGREGR
jgi:predicted AAA+ superfamily ATPase